MNFSSVAYDINLKNIKTHNVQVINFTVDFSTIAILFLYRILTMKQEVYNKEIQNALVIYALPLINKELCSVDFILFNISSCREYQIINNFREIYLHL